MAEVDISLGENDVDDLPEDAQEVPDNLPELENAKELENAEEQENTQELEISKQIHDEQEPENEMEQGKLEELENAQDPEESKDQEDSKDLENEQEPESELEQDNAQENAEIQESSQIEQKQRNDEDFLAGGGGGEKRWPGWPGESIFRMLVPVQKVGSIIGRKGEFIKKLVEETRARIKILDGPPWTAERAVMVSGKEEPESSLPPAIDGLLRVHKRIVDGLEDDSSQAPAGQVGKVSTRLLVPASQAGSLIGKQGGTVKSIQEASNCIVRVLGSEDLPVFALQDDRVVEVVGDPAGVHKGVELITSHLRKFLVDRSIVHVFETQMQASNSQKEHMPSHQSWGPPQRVPPNAGGGPGFGPSHYMSPPHEIDNYYQPADMLPPMDARPHHGISAYGRDGPMIVHASSNAHSTPSMATQVTQHMQIPLSYADAVIGTAGANISYIRRASGATVTIQETRGVPGEMTVEISGTTSQVQAAQQLTHNFMAEAAAAAAAATQTQSGASTDEHGYNSYAPHRSANNAPAPANPGYGSVYGGNYGY